MENKRIIAIDGRNGMTYIGEDINPFLEKLAEFIFWGEREYITNYCVVPTTQLVNTEKGSYCSKVKKFYEGIKRDKGRIVLKHKNIQTVHKLDEL